MKFVQKCLGAGLLGMAILLISSSSVRAQDSDYSFKVINRTEVTIKKLMVSVDNKKWGFFDIGAGIGAGKSADLVWSKTTDSEPCKQWVKAVYADKSESKPVKFDFCEEDLELEFTE